jgi:hypothetical protein
MICAGVCLLVFNELLSVLVRIIADVESSHKPRTEPTESRHTTTTPVPTTTDGSSEDDPSNGCGNSEDPLQVPQVENTKLQNIINNLYKGVGKDGNVGNGTTADALRYENETGQPVGNKFHLIKAGYELRGLRNLLRSGNLRQSDSLVAQSLYDELKEVYDAAPSK